MGFFFEQSAAEARSAAKRSRVPAVIPIEMMKEQGCRACARDAADVIKEDAQGSRKPLVYVLLSEPPIDGSCAPGDSTSARLLEKRLRKVTDLVRYGYAVRCRSHDGKFASMREATCCSGFFEKDILDTKPVLIVGVGNRVLQWALPDRAARSPAQDDDWRGKIFPVSVQGEPFWYMQLQDLDYVLSKIEKSEYTCGEEMALDFDVKKLSYVLETLAREESKIKPHVVTPEEAERGVRWLTGDGEMDWEELCEFLDRAAKSQDVGIDYETTAQIRPWRKPGPEVKGGLRILTAAISTGDETLAFPVHHPLGWRSDTSLQLSVTRALIDFIARAGLKVAHNLAFELEWTAVELHQELLWTGWGDSMAAMHSLDPRRGSLGLGDTTRQLFGFDIKALSNLDTGRLIEYPLPDVLRYNGMDAKWCLLAWREAKRLSHPDRWERTLKKCRRAPVLAMAQIMGIDVDLEFAQQLEHQLDDEIAKAHRILYRANEVIEFERKFGRPFTTTNDDVMLLLREVMGMNVASVDESVLGAIPQDEALAPHQILAIRGAEKLRGTYVLPLTKPTAVINGKPVNGVIYCDGRVHTNYNQMIAISDRTSADDPNVQNYPKRKRKEARGVLRAGHTPSGRKLRWVACDYGAIQARMIACESEDYVLVDAFWTDFDIHGHWADRFLKDYPKIKDWIITEFEVDGDDMKLVRKTLRQEAKNKWVFPQFFGASAYSCAANLHMPDDVAKRFADELWDQFKGVRKWQRRLLENYEKKFYVESMTGHRRYGPISYNEIINTPIQADEADTVLDAQTRCADYATATGKDWFYPPVNVHDDLGFHIPDEYVEESIDPIAHMMCNAQHPRIIVPIVVEVSYSPDRWNELKEVGIYRSDKLGFHRR